MKIVVKAILKNEVIIDKEVNVPDEVDKKDVEKYIEETKQTIKDSFRDYISFYLEFGDVIINGNDLSAISIKLEEGN